MESQGRNSSQTSQDLLRRPIRLLPRLPARNRPVGSVQTISLGNCKSQPRTHEGCLSPAPRPPPKPPAVANGKWPPKPPAVANGKWPWQMANGRPDLRPWQMGSTPPTPKPQETPTLPRRATRPSDLAHGAGPPAHRPPGPQLPSSQPPAQGHPAPKPQAPRPRITRPRLPGPSS